MNKLNLVNARVTYRKAPIHTLEKFAFKDLESAYKQFRKKNSIKECIILQTCNRVEVYAVSGDDDYETVVQSWARSIGQKKDSFMDVIELSSGRDAVSHLLELASGLDSLVIGEDQVLGQVKRALVLARKNKCAGSQLSILFDKAVKVGSKVRSSTGINKGSVSYGSMAVKLADEYLGGLGSKKVLLVGTGEAASLVAKALKKRNLKFLVTSRTIERAEAFAKTVGGRAITFETALDTLNKVDALFVATTAPYYLITFERIETAMRKRKSPMAILDLSNPRTVEEKITNLGVKLINIDEVSALVEKNIKSRMNEVRQAEKIVKEEVFSVQARIKRLEVEPVVDSLFKKVDAIRERELGKALHMIGNLSEEQKRIIEHLSYAIVEGVLSNPMDNLRKASEDGDKELVKAVSKLFKYER